MLTGAWLEGEGLNIGLGIVFIFGGVVVVVVRQSWWYTSLISAPRG